MDPKNKRINVEDITAMSHLLYEVHDEKEVTAMSHLLDDDANIEEYPDKGPLAGLLDD